MTYHLEMRLQSHLPASVLGIQVHHWLPIVPAGFVCSPLASSASVFAWTVLQAVLSTDGVVHPASVDRLLPTGQSHSHRKITTSNNAR